MHNLQTEEKLENIMYYHHHSLLHRLQIKQETIERKERQQRTACCINLCEAAFVIHDLRNFFNQFHLQVISFNWAYSNVKHFASVFFQTFFCYWLVLWNDQRNNRQLCDSLVAIQKKYNTKNENRNNTKSDRDSEKSRIRKKPHNAILNLYIWQTVTNEWKSYRWKTHKISHNNDTKIPTTITKKYVVCYACTYKNIKNTLGMLSI